jgi:hypothetical protein
VDDVPINVEQIVAVIVAFYDVPAPNLVVKRKLAHSMWFRLSVAGTLQCERL